jgi:hypothetical protein
MTEQAESRSKTIIPGIGEFNLPLTRNDLLLLLVAFSEFALGLESYLAHLISGGIKPAEMTPVVFGPVAGTILLLAMVLRISKRQATIATLIIMGVAAASIMVGILGSAFHWDRALTPSVLPGDRIRWRWLIFAPPALAPLSFAGIGFMAIISALRDTKPETGRLELPGVLTFRTPLTQTQQLLWLVALGLLAATISAFLDHGRTGFENLFVWTPVVFGMLGTVATVLLALYEKRTSTDFLIFFWVMLLMVVVGVLGMGLHVNSNLAESSGAIVEDRFIRGAPVLAPMLFAHMGILGIITMIGADVEEE